jgi:NADP-dependent 3-hydroxy acid dehydrogenase YdfG
LVGSLRNKVAVVTGASSGIGATVARALNADGAHVALAARREEALLEIQADLESGDGRKCMVFPTDVTDREEVRSLVARAEEELGPVEILVNCAGVMYYSLMKNQRAQEWERTVEVNCKGALNCVGAVLSGMLERGRGHIVTISSDAGRKVFPVATDLIEMSGDEEALEEYGQPGESRVLDPEDVAASVVHALVQPEHVAVNEILVEPRDEPI